MRPVFVVVQTVDAEHVLEVASADDEDAVEAICAEDAHPAFGLGALALGAWIGVRITPMPLVRKTSSKAALNFLSRSWTTRRNACSSPSVWRGCEPAA